MKNPPETNHKFVVVLKKGLDSGVAMNAASHMVACLVARASETDSSAMQFVDYVDGDGNAHPVSALPLVVLGAKSGNHIHAARLAALDASVPFVDFTESMTRDTYKEQMERTAALREEELTYWGLCMFGLRNEIDPITRKFSLWQ